MLFMSSPVYRSSASIDMPVEVWISVAAPTQVLGEIRPYLVGTGGGELLLDSIDGPIVKVKITGPAANVMTVRVAVTQKLREKIPSIAAVQLL
jgi:Fe-S cluster biogenesis protein NfuA